MDLSQPKISFVTTARNDDYGGNLLNRILISLKVIVEFTNKYKIPSEYILVDYNPVPDKAPMSEVITIKNNEYVTIRFITVPSTLHDKIKQNKIPLYEYIAKNIGIRRAQGEFIAVINPDIIFPEDFFKDLAAQKFQNNTFYRVHRRDSSIDYFDPKLSVSEIIKKASKSTTLIHYNKTSVYTSYRLWFFDRFLHSRTWNSFKLSPLFNRWRDIDTSEQTMHENAAGDFLLMHRDMWDKARGYDETPLSSFMDSYILYILLCYGFSQKILPYSIFHINHIAAKAGRPEVSVVQFRKDVEEMLKTKKPYKINSPDWGFPQENFKEVVI